MSDIPIDGSGAGARTEDLQAEARQKRDEHSGPPGMSEFPPEARPDNSSQAMKEQGPSYSRGYRGVWPHEDHDRAVNNRGGGTIEQPLGPDNSTSSPTSIAGANREQELTAGEQPLRPYNEGYPDVTRSQAPEVTAAEADSKSPGTSMAPEQEEDPYRGYRGVPEVPGGRAGPVMVTADSSSPADQVPGGGQLASDVGRQQMMQLKQDSAGLTQQTEAPVQPAKESAPEQPAASQTPPSVIEGTALDETHSAERIILTPEQQRFTVAQIKEALAFAARYGAERNSLLAKATEAIQNAHIAYQQIGEDPWKAVLAEARGAVAVSALEQLDALEKAMHDALSKPRADHSQNADARQQMLQEAGLSDKEAAAIEDAWQAREELIVVRDLSPDASLLRSMLDAEDAVKAADAQRPLLEQIAKRMGDFLGIASEPLRQELQRAEEEYQKHLHSQIERGRELAADPTRALADIERARQDVTASIFPREPGTGPVRTVQELVGQLHTVDPSRWDAASPLYGGPVGVGLREMSTLKQEMRDAGHTVTELPDLPTFGIKLPSMLGVLGERFTQWLTNTVTHDFTFGGERFMVTTERGGVLEVTARTVQHSRSLGFELDSYMKVDSTAGEARTFKFADGSTLKIQAVSVIEQRTMGPSQSLEKEVRVTLIPRVVSDPAGEFINLMRQTGKYNVRDEMTLFSSGERHLAQVKVTYSKPLGGSGLQLDANLTLTVEASTATKTQLDNALATARSFDDLSNVFKAAETTVQKLSAVLGVDISVPGTPLLRGVSVSVEGTPEVVLDAVQRTIGQIGDRLAGNTQPTRAEIDAATIAALDHDPPASSEL